MSDNHIVVTVSGPSMSGKSVIAAEIAKLLADHGLTVNIDLGEELGFEERELLSSAVERNRRIDHIKSNGLEVTVCEKQTPRVGFEKNREQHGSRDRLLNW